MAEEFQESEVIFHENNEDDSNPAAFYNSQLESANNTAWTRKKLIKTTTMSNKRSVPVRIPGNCSWLEELDGDDGEIVPPHLIVARRVAGKVMAFSVCTGNEATLKGRNMSQVRNSILRMTGFLET